MRILGVASDIIFYINRNKSALQVGAALWTPPVSAGYYQSFRASPPLSPLGPFFYKKSASGYLMCLLVASLYPALDLRSHFRAALQVADHCAWLPLKERNELQIHTAATSLCDYGVYFKNADIYVFQGEGSMAFVHQTATESQIREIARTQTVVEIMALMNGNRVRLQASTVK